MATPLRSRPPAQRPRERIATRGARELDDRELLALLLGSGGPGRSVLDVAAALLDGADGSLRTVAGSEPRALERVDGVGPARAAAVAAAFELGRRAAAESARSGDRIRGPSDVHRRLAPLLRDRRQEEFWSLYLDTQNRVLAERRLTVGLLDASLVHPREVFAPALVQAASSLVLAHNHPSGDPTPSPEDLEVTRQMVRSGELLGIRVRDHVVIGDGRYVSLMERGLLDGETGG
jgi:DNA repair protein RadC